MQIINTHSHMLDFVKTINALDDGDQLEIFRYIAVRAELMTKQLDLENMSMSFQVELERRRHPITLSDHDVRCIALAMEAHGDEPIEVITMHALDFAGFRLKIDDDA